MIEKHLRTYTLAEVGNHNLENDSWIVIDNSVYDVSKWINKHPGGSKLLFNLAGKDCTDEFQIFHYEPNFKLLNSFFIGKLVQEEQRQPSPLSKDIRTLHEKIKRHGAFKPDYLFYIQRAGIISMLFLACVTLLLSSSALLPCVLSAVCLGFFWQQLAFVGHDLGHHVVTHNKKMDDMIAVFVGNVLQGISLEWWKHSHNTHHTITNSVSHDPDIQHLPVLAVSNAFFKNLYSHYHDKVLHFNSIAQMFVSRQQYLFYFIMTLARFNLYAQSFIHNIVGPGSKSPQKKKVELISLCLFWCWILPLCALTGSFWHGLIFLIVSHATAGIVHVQICISHFSMETYDGIPQHAFVSDGYVKSQLTTTANINCSPHFDFFHGGLQFQIEHHLFPHLTRSKLRYVHEEMVKLCKKHDIPYFHKTFYEANYDVVMKLRETSKELKMSEMFWDGLNLVG